MVIMVVMSISTMMMILVNTFGVSETSLYKTKTKYVLWVEIYFLFFSFKVLEVLEGMMMLVDDLILPGGKICPGAQVLTVVCWRERWKLEFKFYLSFIPEVSVGTRC